MCGLLACADDSTSSVPVPVPNEQPLLQVSPDERAVALRAVLEQDDLALGVRTAVERRQLMSLYGAPEASFLWSDATGRPTTDARDALTKLETAESEGLDPEDYQGAALARGAAALEGEGASDAEALARFDVGLSLHLLRYWRELHMGRVDPRSIGFRMNAPVDDHDFPAMLRDALGRQRLRAATDELRPPLPLYRALVAALATYRGLADQATPLQLPVPKASTKPGAPLEDLEALHRRLVLLGDLPADAPVSTADGLYEGAIVEGVKHFQLRHGLDADGAMGRSTVAALNVTLDGRVRQLELALERLRWLPHLDEQGFLAINIPMFRLWGWDTAPERSAPVFDLGVIVGRALNTQTPVFVEQMRHLIFRPYWNVPPSILRGEILPAIARDPTYLDRNDMEIVSGQSDEATPVAMTRGEPLPGSGRAATACASGPGRRTRSAW